MDKSNNALCAKWLVLEAIKVQKSTAVTDGMPAEDSAEKARDRR